MQHFRMIMDQLSCPTGRPSYKAYHDKYLADEEATIEAFGFGDIGTQTIQIEE